MLCDLQSGRSNHGDAYFSAVYWFMKDPTVTPGLHNHQEVDSPILFFKAFWESAILLDQHTLFCDEEGHHISVEVYFHFPTNCFHFKFRRWCPVMDNFVK